MRFTVAILIVTVIVCKCKTSEVIGDTTTEYVQDYTEVVLTDNCTPMLSNLKINESSEKLNITWDGNLSEACDFHFKITISEQNKRNSITKNLNTTSFLYKYIKPCTKYVIVVELLQNDPNLTSPRLVEKYETDSIAFNQIEKLNFSTTTSAIRLSWKAHKYAHVCKIRYVITANTPIPYFRFTNRTEHWIKNLDSCTEYNVSVTPSSRLRSEFDENTPYLMHPITTLPENVNDIRLEVDVATKTSNISWAPPDYNKCIREYKITINNNTFTTTNDTFLERSKNLYCTEIQIEAVNYNNATGAPARLLEPGPVDNLTTTTTENSFTATWEPPENSDCVLNYSVILTGRDFNQLDSTDSLTYTFYGLKPCSDFEIKVAARSTDNELGDYTNGSDSTAEPEDLGSVRSLALEGTLATWEPPLDRETCNYGYLLKLHDYVGNEVDEGSTNETTLEIGYDSWIGCMNYTVSITPTLGLLEGTPAKENISFSAVANEPECVEKEVNKTSAVLECTLDSYESNMCAINKIVIDCEASTEQNESWIIRNATASENIIDDFNRNPINVTIINISEFTDYTCQALVANSAGNSPKSDPILFKTQEEVPDAPTLIEVTATANNLEIAWKPPEKIPGIQQNYLITIKSNGAQYFQPTHEFCTRKEETVYLEEVESSVDTYNFPKAFPRYKYEVYINASTRAGFGPPSETEVVVTAPGIPDEPRNTNLVTNNTTTITDYEANATLTWMFPCYTNGEMRHFGLEVLGIPYADLDKPHDTRWKGKIIPVNSEIENLDYEYVMEDLYPAFNYSIYIKSVIEGGFENKQYLTFLSPESYPGAPVFNPITEVENDSFTLEWNAPAEKNGLILHYNLVINNEGALYWVPPDCVKNNATYPFKLSGNEHGFVFTVAKPFHNYSAYITASTSIGTGSESEALLTETLPTVPTPVRNLLADPTTPTAEDYNSELSLAFKHPCDLYGSFKQFTIILNGTRSNYAPHEQNKSITAKQQDYKFTFELLAEYDYNLTVQVVTETHNTSSKLEFSSPSGVPPHVSKQIQAPVVLDDPTQANFTFDRDLFDERYGAILYYALILGEENHEEVSRYGFWDGKENTWPDVGNIRAEMHIEPYQATPVGWNPFLGESCYNYTFVLGDGSSEFNKPLRDGVTYTIKVRGFTQFGYRDSPTIIFLVPAITNLALILGLVFGLFGTGLLLGFIFILWRKRKQWEMKKESIKSIPLTPIPVSIKQFSQYYDELKINSDRLKHEFTLLSSKSNELIHSNNDGITPENKKKNRYTNIIPYDETRVKLMDTNDNHPVTDYINASYIMGYSGTMEYIATQGPMEHTCMDFWKMVIQENSSLIVMVAQFVEQNKDKCYKYFPNNHENMELENGIAIRCCTELDFKTHIVRTLLIQKDLQQWTVTHLQFTDWPDFGCPIGTEVILEFCQIMREHAERNSDPIIIHCSAGVGRTGTLIALDIVLQAISYKRDIDIFGTVLNLRRDRKNMVQTEKQYLYIHSCIKDAIEHPPAIQCADTISKEPVYENLEDIKNSQSDNNIKESIF